MIKNLIILLILISLVGCNPFISKELRHKNKCNRKLERLSKKCDIIRYDTTYLNFDTTIVTKEVRVDTLVSTQFDTLEITKDKFHLRLIKTTDTLLINGGCDADTVYIDKIIKVPYTKVEQIKLTPLEHLANWFSKFWWWLIIGLIIYLVYKKIF